MAASYEALRSQIEFELPEIGQQESAGFTDAACSLQSCMTCDDLHDHTEMVYCDSCEGSFCSECWQIHLDVNTKCRAGNGAD